MNTPIDWRQLAHRWFVQYNPLYLVSAGCVLLGLHLVSAGLSRGNGLLPELVVTVLTEGYQLLLIAAAALLVRIRRPRPAVMLALVQVVYLCDLTFQNGVASNLGEVGILVSAVWWLLTVVKIRALGWALRLRLSRSAWLVPGLGAAGVAALPHLLFSNLLHPQVLTILISGLVFAIGSAGLWSSRTVESLDALDAWGETVLRRAVGGAFWIWTLLGLAHLVFWSVQADLSPTPALLTALGLLAASRARSEGLAWLAVLGVLAAAVTLTPPGVWSTALLAAVALTLRGLLGRPNLARLSPAPTPVHPYRGAAARPPEETAPRPRAPSGPAARRCYLGALCCLQLAIWTLPWQGGPWPAHLLGLDLGFSILFALLAWKGRVRLALAPLLALWAHAAIAGGLVAGPRTTLHWGGLLLGIGFGLLVLGVAITWLLRSPAQAQEIPRVNQRPS